MRGLTSFLGDLVEEAIELVHAGGIGAARERGGQIDGEPGEGAQVVEISHEIADVVIYLDLLAQSYGIDLGTAVRRKFNVVSDRRGSEVTL